MEKKDERSKNQNWKCREQKHRKSKNNRKGEAKVTHFDTDQSYKTENKILDGHPIPLKRVPI